MDRERSARNAAQIAQTLNEDALAEVFFTLTEDVFWPLRDALVDAGMDEFNRIVNGRRAS